MEDPANERGTNDSVGRSFRSIMSPTGNAETPNVKKQGLVSSMIITIAGQ